MPCRPDSRPANDFDHAAPRYAHLCKYFKSNRRAGPGAAGRSESFLIPVRRLAETALASDPRFLYFTPPFPPGGWPASVGASIGRPATHRKDSRMKRLILLACGLLLSGVLSGCCCTPCCGTGCGYGGCGPGGCTVPGGIPAASY